MPMPRESSRQKISAPQLPFPFFPSWNFLRSEEKAAMGFNVISILINIKLRPCFPMYILVKTGNNLSKSREPPCCFFLSAAVPALGSAHCQYLVSILHTYRILLSDSLPNPSFSSPQQQLLTAQRNRGSQNQSSESPWDDFRDA